MYQSLAKIAPSCATTGPARAHHLAVREAGDEARRRQVLRTGVADAAVDHRQLAVVAQVHARCGARASPPASIARTSTPAARRRGHGAQAALGADVVQQQAAMHAAPRGLGQRVRHRVADRVVEHQVVQQVHLEARRRDVGQQRRSEAA